MISALIFSVAAVAATLAGGALVLLRHAWTERHLRRLLALSSGALLGITILHVLPEAWSLNARWANGAALAAFLIFFVIEQFTVVHACSEALEKCAVHTMGYGALTALFFHSFADGLAMGFAFLYSPTLGVVVSGALVIHKFTDGVTLSTIFLEAHDARKRIWKLNTVLALATPAGVAVCMSAAPLITPRVLTVFLGLAAGGFLYVSTADILPRLHRSRDPLCWVFLLIGIAVAAFYPHG